MNGRDVNMYGACSLENLTNGNYTYHQDDDTLNKILSQPAYRDINKRKRHGGRYEWEHDDAA